MLEIDKKKFIFKLKEIWFADSPFDYKNADRVIFRECKANLDLKDFLKTEFYTLVIDLNKSLEEIWKDMDKSSCRYRINRAEREGVKIKIIDDLRQFEAVNDNFRRLKGLSITKDLTVYKDFGIIFMAYYKDEPIAGQFYIFDDKNFRWLLGASKRLEADKKLASIIGCANRMLIWEAIKYAKEVGIKEFDLGGYYKGSDKKIIGINTFKEGFGGNEVIHYIYQKDYSLIYKFLSAVKQNLRIV